MAEAKLKLFGNTVVVGVGVGVLVGHGVKVGVGVRVGTGVGVVVGMGVCVGVGGTGERECVGLASTVAWTMASTVA